MISRFGNYQNVQAYGDFEALPKGGYVCKVLGVELMVFKGKECVKLSCDIAEGDFAGYFAERYKANTNEDKKWTCNYLLWVPNDSSQDWEQRKFKTDIEAFEDSNNGFHFDWDEKKFKGLLIGGLFNEREYEKTNGDVGRATNLAKLTTVEKVREGKFKLPEDKLLNTTTSGTVNDGFMNIPDGAEDEGLPFN